MLKLSEAIMVNGMTKPQGFGADSIFSSDAPCAIGGALLAVGRQSREGTVANFSAFRDVWPWMGGPLKHQCPACGDFRSIANTQLGVIWHLNDTHRWTRAQIAEWVASIEPTDSEQPIEEVAEEAAAL